MDDNERALIVSEIAQIVRQEFHIQFRRAFEETHYITLDLPLQPCNEIRNATDHLGQALFAKEFSRAKIHLENCRGHVALATIYCRQIAILRREEIIADCVRGIEEDGGAVLIDFRADLTEIRRRCNSEFPRVAPIATRIDGILVSETEKRLKVLEDIEAVLLSCNTLHLKLRTSFQARQLIKARAQGIWIRQGRPHGADTVHWRQAEREFPEDDTE